MEMYKLFYNNILERRKTMIKFEQIGINKQQTAETKAEALKYFNTSCSICCYRGIKLNCDKCAIKVAHELTISIVHN
jgi:hypothetical protein